MTNCGHNYPWLPDGFCCPTCLLAKVEQLKAVVAQHLASIAAMAIDEARWAEVERLDAAIRADKACGDG